METTVTDLESQVVNDLDAPEDVDDEKSDFFFPGLFPLWAFKS
jgi:hypothetical protein